MSYPSTVRMEKETYLPKGSFGSWSCKNVPSEPFARRLDCFSPAGVHFVHCSSGKRSSPGFGRSRARLLEEVASGLRLCPHCCDKWLGSHDVHDACQIVGQHV